MCLPSSCDPSYGLCGQVPWQDLQVTAHEGFWLGGDAVNATLVAGAPLSRRRVRFGSTRNPSLSQGGSGLGGPSPPADTAPVKAGNALYALVRPECALGARHGTLLVGTGRLLLESGCEPSVLFTMPPSPSGLQVMSVDGASYQVAVETCRCGTEQ